jgi:hypothetical protein
MYEQLHHIETLPIFQNFVKKLTKGYTSETRIAVVFIFEICAMSKHALQFNNIILLYL